jgi:ketosteroid isomerase-like protein
MANNTPEEAVERVDEAFNRRDIEAILDFYEEGAAIVAEPGRIVQGKANIRQTFEAILGLEGVARQLKTNVIEAGDLALFTSRWSFSGTAPDGTPFSRESIATAVFRKQSDGAWKCVIDNSYGPAVLE